jgi:hypothetical protein
MTRNKKRLRQATAMAMTAGMLALTTGCQSTKINPTAGGGGITGNWQPDSGGYTAIFDNGRFSTTATDTGNVISQGSYLAVSASEIQLRWTSNITGLENSAACNRPQANTLECTDAGGRNFVLRRSG